MKSLRDDPEYSQAEDTMSQLAHKRAEIEKEINALDRQIVQFNIPPADLVEDALSIKPGVPSGVIGFQERHLTLREQLPKLDKAMREQSGKAMYARRNASHRLFSANAGTYQKLAAELLDQAEKLLEANKALTEESTRLRRIGCEDIPEIQFPNFGLSERLPYWRDELKAQFHAINLTIKAHSNVKK